MSNGDCKFFIRHFHIFRKGIAFSKMDESESEDVKSDTSGDMPTFYTSEESEKREHSHRFTSSDVDCFKIEEKKKKKVLRKRRHKIKAVNSSLETVKEETIKAHPMPFTQSDPNKNLYKWFLMNYNRKLEMTNLRINHIFEAFVMQTEINGFETCKSNDLRKMVVEYMATNCEEFKENVKPNVIARETTYEMFIQKLSYISRSKRM